MQTLKSKASRYLKQQEALGLDPGSPEWVSSKLDCACTGSSAVGDFVKKEMPFTFMSVALKNTPRQ